MLSGQLRAAQAQIASLMDLHQKGKKIKTMTKTVTATAALRQTGFSNSTAATTTITVTQQVAANGTAAAMTITVTEQAAASNMTMTVTQSARYEAVG